MNRCRDYFGFAVWFTGIGYAVLWPFSANGGGGHPFGASIVCGDGHGGVMAALCGLPHPFALPVGLHVLGIAAAIDGRRARIAPPAGPLAAASRRRSGRGAQCAPARRDSHPAETAGAPPAHGQVAQAFRLARHAALVSRFRRSYPVAARFHANVGTERIPAHISFSCSFGFDIPPRSALRWGANVKSAARRAKALRDAVRRGHGWRQSP